MIVRSVVIYPALMLVAISPVLQERGLAQAPAGLAVRYSLVEKEPIAGQPVYLLASVQNSSADDIIVDFRSNSHGYGAFRARITRPDGRIIEAPTQAADEMLPGRKVALAPRESYGTRILLNAWVDLDEPGRYTIDVAATNPILTSRGM